MICLISFIFLILKNKQKKNKRKILCVLECLYHGLSAVDAFFICSDPQKKKKDSIEETAKENTYNELELKTLELNEVLDFVLEDIKSFLSSQFITL